MRCPGAHGAVSLVPAVWVLGSPHAPAQLLPSQLLVQMVEERLLPQAVSLLSSLPGRGEKGAGLGCWEPGWLFTASLSTASPSRSKCRSSCGDVTLRGDVIAQSRGRGGVLSPSKFPLSPYPRRILLHQKHSRALAETKPHLSCFGARWLREVPLRRSCRVCRLPSKSQLVRGCRGARSGHALAVAACHRAVTWQWLKRRLQRLKAPACRDGGGSRLCSA